MRREGQELAGKILVHKALLCGSGQFARDDIRREPIGPRELSDVRVEMIDRSVRRKRLAISGPRQDRETIILDIRKRLDITIEQPQTHRGGLFEKYLAIASGEAIEEVLCVLFGERVHDESKE